MAEDIKIDQNLVPSYAFQDGYVHSVDRKTRKGSLLVRLKDCDGNVLKGTYDFPDSLDMREDDRVVADSPTKGNGKYIPVVRAQIYREDEVGAEKLVGDYLGHRDSNKGSSGDYKPTIKGLDRLNVRP